MERTSLYEDDLTETHLPSPAQREITEHSLALDPDVAPEDEDDEEEDADESEDLED